MSVFQNFREDARRAWIVTILFAKRNKRRLAQLMFGECRKITYVHRFIYPRLKELGCDTFCLCCHSGLKTMPDGTVKNMTYEEGCGEHDPAAHAYGVIKVGNFHCSKQWIRECVPKDFPAQVELTRENPYGKERRKDRDTKYVEVA